MPNGLTLWYFIDLDIEYRLFSVNFQNKQPDIIDGRRKKKLFKWEKWDKQTEIMGQEILKKTNENKVIIINKNKT